MSEPTPPRLLYCHCAFAQVVPPETKAAVLDALAVSGRPFHAVPDLCEMSARRDPLLAGMAQDGAATIVACDPRAVRWLVSAAGAPLPETGIRVLNMRVSPAEEILGALDVTGADAP